jgi:epoxyqueuosine reductase
MDKALATSMIKAKAIDLGFFLTGISPVAHMDEEAKNLEKWLKNGFHGKMSYMENHFDKRVDPGKLIPGAKSILSFGYNYYTEKKQLDELAPKISKYAFGRDYHKVVKSRLKSLFNYIREEIGSVEGRYFVDSAPILERDWAKKSGLGWIGKNTLLINPKKGSYFFLAEMILDLELEYDTSIKDHCGTCTKCIEACPTEAISPKGYVLNGSKCISYLTIELKDSIPDEFSEKMENWMFGCDICQDVCPWNRFSSKHNESDFEPTQKLLDMTEKNWQDLDENIFDKLFKGSPVKRTKYQGLRRNIDFLKKS